MTTRHFVLNIIFSQAEIPRIRIVWLRARMLGGRHDAVIDGFATWPSITFLFLIEMIDPSMVDGMINLVYKLGLSNEN
jgi:hypothetical protein